MNKLLIAVLALVGLPCLAAFAGDHAAVTISGAWVRALPPGQPNTAAYLAIENQGKTSVAVVGASAEVASSVEFHTTIEVEGYQRMAQLEQLELGPGESLVLAPGGIHLMLLGLDHMPVPGDSVPLCLHLSGGGEVCTSAQVRKTAAAEPAHDHHKHM